MAIRYFEDGVRARLTGRRRLSAFLMSRIKDEIDVHVVELAIVFCDDETLWEKNKTFLGHDTLTDILTFDLSEVEGELQAEIYISTDRVRENAERFERPYQEELHRVVFHGCLHLCGYDDLSKTDALQMRAKEQEYLSAYFGNAHGDTMGK